jgi:hypothetical protein
MEPVLLFFFVSAKLIYLWQALLIVKLLSIKYLLDNTFTIYLNDLLSFKYSISSLFSS